jgi:hypothetical protein
MKHVLAFGVLALCLSMPRVAAAQQGAPKQGAPQQGAPQQGAVITAEDEEQMDAALRRFGHVSGQAFQCHSKPEQAKLERTALNVGTNILRLFGSDRAFYFAAAFGVGMSEQVDPKKCPEAIKQATAMIAKLKTLSER